MTSLALKCSRRVWCYGPLHSPLYPRSTNEGRLYLVPSRLASTNSLQLPSKTFKATVCRTPFQHGLLAPSRDNTYTARSFTQSSRLLTASEDPKSSKTPILQQTAELRKQLRARVSQNLTHENIYNVPNILTVSRLIATPIIGYLIVHDAHYWATGLLFYAGVTDLIDGWVARKWNLQTVVGTVIDPLADKALMATLTVCLAINGGLPIWLATLIFGRDASLAIAAIYYRYASLPAPKTFARYWDFSLPSAEVHPTGISKSNTFLQLLLLGATTALPVAGPSVDHLLMNLTSGGLGVGGAMTAAQVIVASTTVWSGVSYLWTKNAVKILGDGSEQQKRRILIKGRTIIGASFLSCAGLALYLET